MFTGMFRPRYLVPMAAFCSIPAAFLVWFHWHAVDNNPFLEHTLDDWLFPGLMSAVALFMGWHIGIIALMVMDIIKSGDLWTTLEDLFG